MEKLQADAVFGNYRIDREIGQGGFATIYLATDVRPAMSRQVALKILDDRMAADASFRERFARESRLAANLDHPNVAPIFDAGEIDGHLYIAMRFIDGIDLKDRLALGPIPPDEVISVVRQIASALDHAHAQGLIHRDVKPGNVLLDHGETTHVYLADFGISKDTTDGADFTQTGLFIGTLYYASPEQIAGGPLDGRSDQYALGCMLFEALTRSPPFTGSLQVIITAHATTTPPRAHQVVPELPPAIDDVIRRAMAKSPADRYPSCSAMVDAAEAALSGTLAPIDEDPESTILYPTAPSQSPASEADSAEAAETSPPAVTAPPSPKRKLVPIAVLVGVVVALIGGAALAATSGSGGSTDPAASSGATSGSTSSSVPADAPATTAATDTAADQFSGPSAIIAPSRVVAPGATEPSVDACGQPTTFEPEQMIDGNPTTAWRVTGDGTGRSVTLDLGPETLVTSVGLINGLAKVDSCDGTDRYLEQRRVTTVEWTFDDGSTVTQNLDPSVRTLQTIEVESITTHVNFEILSTTEPGDRDFTPISEIEVQGVASDAG